MTSTISVYTPDSNIQRIPETYHHNVDNQALANTYERKLSSTPGHQVLIVHLTPCFLNILLKRPLALLKSSYYLSALLGQVDLRSRI